MRHIIYKTTNLIDGKYYYGKHSTQDINDGYLGSGTLLKRAIEKHGAENFIRTIICECATAEDINKMEALIVTEEYVNDPNCYNMTIGGEGGWYHINNDPEKRADSSVKTKKAFAKKSPEELARIGEAKRNLGESNGMYGVARCGESNPMWGKQHTQEARDKISKTKTGTKMSDNARKSMSKSQKKRWSDPSHKNAMSEAQKQSFIKDPERAKKLSEHVSSTKWYNNGTKSIRRTEHPGDGWVEGRLGFKKRKKHELDGQAQ